MGLQDPDLCVGTEYVDSGRSSPTGHSRTCRSRPGHEDADTYVQQLGEDLTYVLSPGVYPIQLGSRTGPGSVTLTVTCLPTFLPATQLRVDGDACRGDRSLLPSLPPTSSPTPSPTTPEPTAAPTPPPTPAPTPGPTVTPATVKWLCPCTGAFGSDEGVPCTALTAGGCMRFPYTNHSIVSHLATTPGYVLNTVANCAGPAELRPINSIDDCAQAARSVGLDAEVVAVSFARGPDGCFYKQSTSELFFNSGGVLDHTDTNRVSLCANTSLSVVPLYLRADELPNGNFRVSLHSDTGCTAAGIDLNLGGTTIEDLAISAVFSSHLAEETCSSLFSFASPDAMSLYRSLSDVCIARDDGSGCPTTNTEPVAATTAPPVLDGGGGEGGGAATPLDPAASCAARGCGVLSFDPGAICQCESNCVTYGDCCLDYRSHCAVNGGTIAPPPPTLPHTVATATSTTVVTVTSTSTATTTTTATTLTTVLATCHGHCGTPDRVGLGSFTCFCDVSCRDTSDCCNDFEQVCQLPVGGIATTAPAALPCVDTPGGSRNCHRCADSTTCSFCREAQYLFGGACVPTCPEGSTPRGTGNFRRECIPPPAVDRGDGADGGGNGMCVTRQQERSSHCNACDDDRTACTQCRDRHYLHIGQCISECPDGSAGVGTGRFNRVCRISHRAETACHGLTDCHACSDDGGRCETCRNMAYLAGGVCVPACPVGSTPQGQGNFNRVCLVSSNGADGGGGGNEGGGVGCVAKRDGCHRCVDSDTCEFCRESQYLHEGVCGTGCPDGYIEQGSGFYRRACIPN